MWGAGEDLANTSDAYIGHIFGRTRQLSLIALFFQVVLPAARRDHPW